jgi:uncharacterized damage-inducible protein DinB
MERIMTTKWFDRKFDFNFGIERYDSLYERLQNASLKYKKEVLDLPEKILQLKPENKWSIKENVGHLLLLEQLWHKRFKEIKERKPEMSPADLSNTATNESSFNDMAIQMLIENFTKTRNKTINFLNGLEQEEFSLSSLHPRLQRSIRIIDMMYFIAEHDDHHLNTIRTIIKNHNI